MKIQTFTLALLLSFGGAAIAQVHNTTRQPTPDSSTKLQELAKEQADARESGGAKGGAAGTATTQTTAKKSANAAAKKSRKTRKLEPAKQG